MSESKLLQRLTDLRRMVRQRLALYGICAVASAAVFAALGLILLDWLLWLPPLLRLVLGVAYVMGGLAGVFRWVIHPLSKRLSLGQIAGTLEQYIWPLADGRLGRFEDRLSSTVDFLSGSRVGSEQMCRRVIANTDRMVADIRFQDALSLRPLVLRGGVLIVAALLIGTVVVASPDFASAGLRRYAAPFSGIEWPREVEIVPLTADKRVAAGESVTLRIRIVRGLRPGLRPLAHLHTTGAETTTLAMQREAPGDYACLVSAIYNDMTCWFEAGDDDTRDRPLHIKVVRRPAVVEALAIIDPPSYVPRRADPVVMDLGTDEVFAVPGSTVTVLVRSSKPLGTVAGGAPDAALELTEGSEIALVFTDDDRTVGASFEFDAAEGFRVRLVDDQGFQNRPDRLYRIQARADQPPDVVLLEPRAVAEVTPNGSVALVIRASDDFGITSLELVAGEPGSQGQLRIPLTETMTVAPAGDRVLGSAEYVWSIAPLNLQPGAALVYHAEAADNYAYRGGQPQIGRSTQLRLRIISQADLDSRLRDQFALLQERIRRALISQESLKDETDALAERTGTGTSLARREVETAAGLAARQARLADRVTDVSRQFRGIRQRTQLDPSEGRTRGPELQDQLGRIAGLLARTASVPMAAASRRLSGAGSPAVGDGRDLLRQAGANQQTAIEALAGIIRSMDQWGDFQEVVAKGRDLLDRQQEVRTRTVDQGKRTLGRRPESLSDDEQAQLRQTRRRQLRIAEETEQLLKRLGRLAERRRAKDPAGADALEYALRAALAGEVVKQMRDAAEAIQSNRTAAAVIGQRTAETGLSRMLAALEERRQRQLAELAKRMAGAEQALAEILRRQRELLEATQEAKRLGAADDVFRQHAGRQRTVKRNSLRLADDIEDMQRAAGPARLVRGAAGSMGRAESALNQTDGTAAEEHQADAIDLLAEAVLELEELARQVDFEAMQRSLAVVQAKLEEIRNRQQEVNEQSARLIHLRAEKKRLSRAQNRRAAKLARTQEQLRPTVEGEVLPLLGEAAVYQWVLQDVLELSDRSSEALDRRRLDEALARDQRRIVEELDLLITALEQAVRLPGPDRYAEGGSSGGGGGPTQAGQQSPVPSVAELLVLKSMQLDLNARTARIGERFDADTASEEELRRVRQLGDRQQRIRKLTERVTQRARSDGP